MATRPTRSPKIDYPASAKTERDAAYDAFSASQDIILEAEKITAPASAQAVANQAKAKAQEVEPLFDAAHAAWTVAMTADEATAKIKAAEASTDRANAVRKLGEANRLLSQAQKLVAEQEAADAAAVTKVQKEAEELKKIVDQVSTIRESIGIQLASVQEDADKAAEKHAKTPTAASLRAFEAVGTAEKAVETAYENAKHAEVSAKRAKTKDVAEKALAKAENAQKAVDDAMVAAGDAVRTVSTATRRAEAAKASAPLSRKDKAKSLAEGEWLKPRLVPIGATIVALLATMVVALAGLPAWMQGGIVVTAMIVAVCAALAVVIFRDPTASQRLAGTIAIIAIVLAVVAVRTDESGGNDGGNASNSSSGSSDQVDEDQIDCWLAKYQSDPACQPEQP